MGDGMSDSVELGKIKKTDRDVTVKDLIKIIEDAGGGGCPLCNNTSFDFVIDGNREGSYLMPFVAKDLYKSEDTTGMGRISELYVIIALMSKRLMYQKF